MSDFLFTLGALILATAAAWIAWLSAERRGRVRSSELQTAAAVAQQQAAALREELDKQHQTAEAARQEAATIQRQAGQTQADLQSQLATARAQLESTQSNLSQQQALLEEANTKLTDAFASVSREALEKNTTAFLEIAQARFATLQTQAAGSLDTRKAEIAGLLKPMQELLTGYQQRLAEIEKSRMEGYGQLQKQIGALMQTESTLTTQTARLVNALASSKARGQWGEITLRKLVEMAGMSAHCDFIEQLSVDTQDATGAAARLRPDMVVQLPLERSIIIDAKAPLAAFLDAAAATDDAGRQTALSRHSQLVKARARELSAKSYWSQFANAPDFVILFLPGEAILYAAVENEPGLIEECLAARVILATPTTLIALLKTIEYGWRQQAMSANAEEIRRLGTHIYDRLATLAGYMSKMGRSLDAAVGSYNEAVRSLESRLYVPARKMAELGVSHAGELPEEVPAVDARPREVTPAKAESSIDDSRPAAAVEVEKNLLFGFQERTTRSRG